MAERPADWDARIEKVRGLWAESQRRDAILADANFRLADELIALAPPGPNGSHNGSTAILREIAQEVGAPDSHLRNIRYVGLQWPAEQRRRGVQWSVYSELARTKDEGPNPKRFSILAKLEEEGGKITVERARQARGAPSMGRIGGVEQKAQRIQKDLGDPDVREALRQERARDEATREAKAAAAAAERKARADAEAEERERKAALKRAEQAKRQKDDGRLVGVGSLLDRLDGASAVVYLIRKEVLEPESVIRAKDVKAHILRRAREISGFCDEIVQHLDPPKTQPKGVIDINEARPRRGLTAG